MDLNLLKMLPSDVTREHYIFRIGQLIDQGRLPSWRDCVSIINKELGLEDEEFLGESAYRKQYQAAMKFVEAEVLLPYSTDQSEYADRLESLIKELKEERVKNNTEKLELNRLFRSNVRDNLIFEKIQESISHITPLPSYSIDVLPPKQNNKEYVLIWGDEHYGKELSIKGLYGETLNEYNPEIFDARMKILFNRLIEIIEKEGISTLHLYNMGDFCDGILRVSQLMTLRMGVVDATIEYAEYMANWINELTKYTNVVFQMTNGNHTELRQLGQPKGTFEKDNMGKVVKTFIQLRLKDNLRFKFIDNPTGMIFDELCGYSILGVHGEVKSMEQTIKEFSYIYNKKVNYLIAGHLHHSKNEEVGMDCEVINVPSVVGLDDYSLKLMKTANPGAKLLVFEETKGKTIEYSIKLN